MLKGIRRNVAYYDDIEDPVDFFTCYIRVRTFNRTTFEQCKKFFSAIQNDNIHMDWCLEAGSQKAGCQEAGLPGTPAPPTKQHKQQNSTKKTANSWGKVAKTMKTIGLAAWRRAAWEASPPKNSKNSKNSKSQAKNSKFRCPGSKNNKILRPACQEAGCLEGQSTKKQQKQQK